MGLRAKFNLVLLAAFALGLAIAAIVTYRLVQENARREVLEEAGIMMAQADAVKTYTVEQIEPLLVGLESSRFLPQSIPFFAAQTSLRALAKQFPDYTFKEAALNPTNPSDKASDWEAALIEEFRQNPTQAQVVMTRDSAEGPVLVLARPIRVDSKDCLTCHSTPAAAPAALTDLYGTKNGFGWPLDSVQGAHVVSVPMRVALDRANRAFIAYLIGLVAAFAITLLLLNLVLHYVIIRPIRRMSAIAVEVSLGNDAPEFDARGHDEVASLAQSFNRMRRSLANALRMLGN